MEPGPQFKQLPMFMTAAELKHGPIEYADSHGFGGLDEMWSDKLRRVSAGGIGGWGRVPHPERGIEEPVQLDHSFQTPRLIDGHHRTAAAYRHSPQALVPVEHTDDEQAHHDDRWAAELVQRKWAERANMTLRSDGTWR